MRSGTRLLKHILRERDLSRLLAAYALFALCEYGVWIAVIVFAYSRGGPTGAGLVAAAQLVPAALCAPLFAAAADRFSPARVLVLGYLGQVLGCGTMATAIATGAPSLLVYTGAVFASTFVAATRPAQTAMLPALSQSVAGLTAANVAVSWLESAAIVLAGALVGAALATVGMAWPFAVAACLLLAAAVAVSGVDVPAVSSRDDLTGVWRDVRQAARAVRANRAAAVLSGLLAVEFVVVGALDVLFVVLAVGILDAGSAWTGYLNAAYGVGGVLSGALVTVLLSRRLGPVIACASLALGAGLAATVISPRLATVALLLVVVGGGRAIFDVAARSLLQRVVAAHLVARVFGFAEAIAMAALAVGSLLTPALVVLVGRRGAVLGVALLIPTAVLLVRRRVARLDEEAVIPVVEISLLRAVPLFRDLPAPALERIAHALVREEVAPGSVVIQEGAPGQDFIVLADGVVEVTHGERVLRVLHRGDGAGEIALVRDLPRTATVTATTPVVLYRLPRLLFLSAVNAHVPTQRRADRIATELIG